MLPEKFILRMKRLLGEEFAEFDAALSRPAVKGVRRNLIKTEKESFESLFGSGLRPISYVDNGYIPEDPESLGARPEHHAGMFYSQDPGAMASAAALEVGEDFYVLDTCSAPGGKSSQIAERLGEGGFLLSNEYVPKRAKIIVANFERLGVRRAMVTSYDTAELSRMFEAFFDLAICDAPCSGEGMFRKCEEALEDWSEENVTACAERQLYILNNTAPTVKWGGYLLYSTCTYSPEENECVVDSFLSSHPEFHIASVRDELVAASSDGIVPEGSRREDLKLTRRFYPHKNEGEGQYVALMKKAEKPGFSPTILYKDGAKSPTKQECAVVEKFFRDNFKTVPRGRLIKQGEGIALVEHNLPIPARSVFMPGIMIGEVRGSNLFPHHQLFSALGKDMLRQVELRAGDARVEKYLRGEEISADNSSLCGWVCITYEGAPLGGGKVSGGRIKNHYPKGLRSH